jgi:hypothetical protein
MAGLLFWSGFALRKSIRNYYISAAWKKKSKTKYKQISQSS